MGTPEQYKQSLIQTGFKIDKENIRTDFALEFFKQMRAKNESNCGPALLGFHTLMQESTAMKVNNMIENIQAGVIAPVEIIVQKP